MNEMDAGDAARQGGWFDRLQRARFTHLLIALSLLLVTAPLASPLDVNPSDMLYLFILGCIIMPISFGLITLGPRYITAAEVSLLMLGETVLGPIWVWMVLHEVPPERTLVGGAVILVTLVVHSLVGLRADPA